MKKFAALLLALMLLTLSVSALAEYNYELIKGTLSDKDVFGQPVALPTDEYSGLFILFDFVENNVVLCGKNSSDKPEGCYWDDMDEVTFVAALIYFLENFSSFTSNGDDFPFAVGITFSADSDSLFAFDADTAARYASIIRGSME